MELIVLGIGVMALGASLVHLAIEGRKTALAPVAAAGKSSPPALLSTSQPAAAHSTTSQQQAFSNTDVLLADALTELLALKEQVKSLQAKVDALTSGRAPSGKSPIQRPVRRRLSRGVA